ncbi:MAG: endolytic transglycosylase MltG [Gammaproteobacteria bacterium]|nr:endolytic transglycosylase MltG [Gammaproteobacteria bacterium]
MTTLRRVCIILVILFLAAGAWFGIAWVNFLDSSFVTEEQGVKFRVPLGASYKTVSTDLYQQHLITHASFFNLLFRYRGDTHHLKAGEYLFPKGSTPKTMIDQIVTGKGMVYHTFTIVPGMTFKQLRQALNKDTELQHTTKNWTDADIMKHIGAPAVFSEGEFCPDTYYFVRDSSDIIILKRAFHAMQIKLAKAWETRAPNLYFQTPYQALIAASIIEKEAKVHEELPLMVGVMINRLKSGMLLQFDPTVIYGVGDRYNGTIYKRDLADNNPYNTYLHKGLPPTPISMPGKEAINAVMHPDVNNYIYFVGRGDHATHQFSQTLPEHYAAVIAAKIYHAGFFNDKLITKYLVKLLPPTSYDFSIVSNHHLYQLEKLSSTVSVTHDFRLQRNNQFSFLQSVPEALPLF